MGCKRIVWPLGEIFPPRGLRNSDQSANAISALLVRTGSHPRKRERLGFRARDQASGHGVGSAGTVVGTVAERVVIGLAIVSSGG